MSGWATFWYWVIWTSLVSYFGLGIIIVIGGMIDVKKMFQRLNEAHAQAAGNEGRAAGERMKAEE